MRFGPYIFKVSKSAGIDGDISTIVWYVYLRALTGYRRAGKVPNESTVCFAELCDWFDGKK